MLIPVSFLSITVTCRDKRINKDDLLTHHISMFSRAFWPFILSAFSSRYIVLNLISVKLMVDHHLICIISKHLHTLHIKSS